MRKLISTCYFIFLLLGLTAQDHSHDDHSHANDQHETGEHSHSDGSHGLDCAGDHGHHGEFDAGQTAFHHIADANVYSIGPLQIPLPCILYAPGKGWDVFMSSKF